MIWWVVSRWDAAVPAWALSQKFQKSSRAFYKRSLCHTLRHGDSFQQGTQLPERRRGDWCPVNQGSFGHQGACTDTVLGGSFRFSGRHELYFIHTVIFKIIFKMTRRASGYNFCYDYATCTQKSIMSDNYSSK